MKTKWLDRRIACPGPYLALCLSQEEWEVAARHLKIKDPGSWMGSDNADATTQLCNGPNGGLCCVICIRVESGRNPIEVAGLLVHEAVHVWQAYIDRIGEKNPGIEQEAYAVQSIAQELMAEYARRLEAA